MRSKTRFLSAPLLLAVSVASVMAQQATKNQTPQDAQAGSVPQTETLPSPQAVQAAQSAHPPGYMEPGQVEILAQRIWAAEFQIHGLLSAIHPEKWKTSNIIRNSFNQTLENLHKALDGLEGWRGEFEKRPDSIYYGFQTYAAINAALPRLDGVARAVSQYENASLGAQYSQYGDQLFDLQQALQPYIAYLLRSPDQFLYVAQTNLAACQKQLGSALSGQSGPAKPLKNTFVEFHPRRSRDGQPGQGKSAREGKKEPMGKPDKKESPLQAQPQPSH